MLRPFAYVLVVFLLSFDVVSKEIRYPNIDGLGESSIGYAVLKLALDKSGKDYQLITDLRATNTERTQFMLSNGQLDVFDSGYNPMLDENFEPIYLPLEMGLLGWRVFITHQDTADSLSSVQTIEDLQSYSFGQGQGWGDIDILENAGLTVLTAPTLKNIINMVQVKRFDILPLGATEAYSLLDRYGDKNYKVIIDDAITLIYPFGRFFYVRKNDKELKHVIEEGMDVALSDGSLLSLLKSHPFSRDAFKRAHLHDRIQIRIETPNLTEGFKSIDPKWWYLP